MAKKREQEQRDNDEQALRNAVLAWYDESGRRLPWRDHGGDAYRVIVSELMLVQTTVATVIPYYERFLARFPTVADLAAADESEVLKLWEGLGYYRRARQLHGLARAVVGTHLGVFPQEEAALLALPGVGRYIAGAVRSFAFDQPAPILEANTIRLLARLIALQEPVESTAGQKRLWVEAERLVDSERPGAFNQAMMDLGSMICTPREPRCIICPVRPFCKAYAEGLTGTLPIRAAKAPPKPGEELSVIIRRPSDQAILLLKRSAKGLWADFWELPTFHTAAADPARRAEAGFSSRSHTDLPGLIQTLLNVEIADVRDNDAKAIGYAVTTHKMALRVVEAELESERIHAPGCPSGWAAVEFVPLDRVQELTMSKAQREAFARFVFQEKRFRT